MVKGIRYQDRDVMLLSLMGEIGILDEDTIRERYFPDDESGAACPKKLRQYKTVGLVEKFEIREQNIYRLTPTGVEEIERLTGSLPKRAGHGDPPSANTLEHRIGTYRVRLAYEDACELAKLDAPRWIMEHDYIPGTRSDQPLAKRLKLYEAFPSGGRKSHTCWADLAGHFVFPAAPPWSLLAYFEYDRSTMTAKEMREKLDGWEPFLRERRYESHWPDVGRHIMRVLFVCKSDERISNLIDVIRDSPEAGFFRFAKMADLVPATLFTEPIWCDVKGELRAMLKG